MEELVKHFPSLYKIKLEENKIDSLEKLKCLKDLPLRKINLLGNPIADKEGKYKKELFKLIETLESVDDTGKNGEQIDSTSYGGEEDDLEGEEFDDEEEFGEEGDEEGGEEDDEEEEEEDKGNKKHKK